MLIVVRSPMPIPRNINPNPSPPTSTGGIPIVVRRCWQGSAEGRTLALGLLRDLTRQSGYAEGLLGGGAVPVLLALSLTLEGDLRQQASGGLQSLARMGPEAIAQEQDLQVGLSRIKVSRVYGEDG